VHACAAPLTHALASCFLSCFSGVLSVAQLEQAIESHADVVYRYESRNCVASILVRSLVSSLIMSICLHLSL
jgi:hypothetical protein